jgi:transposase
MDEAWLASQLESGRSIESIAREVARAPSTVAYWVNKYGLASAHAPRHAARGGIERARLESLVATGLSLRAIAAEVGVSYATVRHWMRRYGLATQRGRRLGASRPAREARLADAVLRCPTHGAVLHVRRGSAGLVCLKCRSEAVSRRRRRLKSTLVADAGGRCVLCGYARYVGALQFHHVDPAKKSFNLAARGMTRSLDRAREEAAKCVLLCANCHAEVEGGIATIARDGPADNVL